MGRWRSITGSPLAYTFVAPVNLSHDRRRAQRHRPQEVPDSAARDVPSSGPIDQLLERDVVVRAAGDSRRRNAKSWPAVSCLTCRLPRQRRRSGCPKARSSRIALGRWRECGRSSTTTRTRVPICPGRCAVLTDDELIERLHESTRACPSSLPGAIWLTSCASRLPPTAQDRPTSRCFGVPRVDWAGVSRSLSGR